MSLDERPTLRSCTIVLAALCALAGCSGFLGESATLRAAREQAYAEHVDEAERLEDAGRLADALDHWRIALAVDPASASARARASALQQRIEARVAELTNEADLAEATGDEATATRRLLEALELEPDNQRLTQRVIAMQRGAARRKVAAGPRPSDLSPGDDPPASGATTTAARNAEEKYRAGVAAFDTDKARAERLFREAVQLDPTHLGARAYLQVLSGQTE